MRTLRRINMGKFKVIYTIPVSETYEMYEVIVEADNVDDARYIVETEDLDTLNPEFLESESYPDLEIDKIEEIEEDEED